ncbi:MAG: pirin family protein [Bacteroidia bacterium]
MPEFNPIKQIVYANEHPMGPMRVRQPLPEEGIEQVGPFVLLHHAAPRNYEANSEPPRLGPHPHRGFEPVTFVFEGGIFHRDSMGNEGSIGDGDVQWMTAGSGILHSEGPSPEFLKKGGTLELIQLWINVPAKDKMVEPKYQDIKAADMPKVFDDAKDKLRLVAGEFNGKKGPASTFTDMIAIMGDMEQGTEVELSFPEGQETLIYILNGTVEINKEKPVEKFHMITFSETKGKIHLAALTDSRLLILNAAPINEPVVAYGPFVMNSMDEIHKAYADYQSGKFGTLTH